jgi:hypothetical protein
MTLTRSRKNRYATMKPRRKTAEKRMGSMSVMEDSGGVLTQIRDIPGVQGVKLTLFGQARTYSQKMYN